MAGIFERMGRSLVGRKKKQAQEESDKVKRGLRQRGMRNRRSMMGKLESMGAADKAREDARKAKAKAGSAKKDKASGIGAVKSPVGTKVDKGFTPGKVRSVGKASTKKAEPEKTEPKKTQVKTTPAKAKVTGRGGRNVGTGENKKANVTREQLKASGVGLTAYLNKFDELGRRPKPSDFKKKADSKPFDPTKPNTGGGPGILSIKPPKRESAMAVAAKLGARPEDEMGMRKGGMMKKKSKGYAKGGMMKTKGYMAGGKMKAKGMAKGGKLPMVEKDGKKVPFYAADGKGKMKAGGMMKSKGMAKGGMKMKSKMTTKGGAKGGGYKKGGKVRGAGIARKGVRPTKMR